MKIPIVKCDECKEVIDFKPKDGYIGFSTTKTGYLYCGRCTHTVKHIIEYFKDK